MKVRCKNIYNEHTKRFEDTSSWLTIGKEYVVLEVEVNSLEKTFYRLIGDNDNKMPALYNASQFEIVDGGMPKNWEVSQLSDGTLIICPKVWQEPGFWEDCYDHDPKALEIYKREARIIYEEEGVL
jgi:hypothetical protein